VFRTAGRACASGRAASDPPPAPAPRRARPPSTLAPLRPRCRTPQDRTVRPRAGVPWAGPAPAPARAGPPWTLAPLSPRCRGRRAMPGPSRTLQPSRTAQAQSSGRRATGRPSPFGAGPQGATRRRLTGCHRGTPGRRPRASAYERRPCARSWTLLAARPCGPPCNASLARKERQPGDRPGCLRSEGAQSSPVCSELALMRPPSVAPTDARASGPALSQVQPGAQASAPQKRCSPRSRADRQLPRGDRWMPQHSAADLPVEIATWRLIRMHFAAYCWTFLRQRRAQTPRRMLNHFRTGRHSASSGVRCKRVVKPRTTTCAAGQCPCCQHNGAPEAAGHHGGRISCLPLLVARATRDDASVRALIGGCKKTAQPDPGHTRKAPGDRGAHTARRICWGP